MTRIFLVLAFVSACGGSGSEGHGDRAIGEGQNVQQTAAAQITIHRASGDETINYAAPRN